MQGFGYDNEIILKWTVPMGEPINKVHILRAAAGQSPQVIADLDGTIDSYSDKNVTKGNTYYYYFLTENKAGNNGKATSPISVVLEN